MVLFRHCLFQLILHAISMLFFFINTTDERVFQTSRVFPGIIAYYMSAQYINFHLPHFSPLPLALTSS